MNREAKPLPRGKIMKRKSLKGKTIVLLIKDAFHGAGTWGDPL
jgi:hypothetical protein